VQHKLNIWLLAVEVEAVTLMVVEAVLVVIEQVQVYL
jgi:hypothetical protein